MQLLFQLVQVIAWLAFASAYEPPGHRHPVQATSSAQITNRHNTCGQGLAGDYSGYITVKGSHTGKEEEVNFFFWFFEARRKPAEAPVILYFNGGPGLSSVYRVFDGSGPCKFDWAGNLAPNGHSINEYANIIYIDQPVGAGFSYGTADLSPEGRAADYLYKFLQLFIVEFPQYRRSEFGIWTSDSGASVGLDLAIKIFNMNDGLIGRKVGTDGEVRIKLAIMGLESPKIDPPMQLSAMYVYIVENPWITLHNFDEGREALIEYLETLQRDLLACAERVKTDCGEVLKRYVAAIRRLTSPKGLPTEFDLWDVRGARHRTHSSRNYMMSRTPGGRWLNNPNHQNHLGVTGGRLGRGPVRFEPWNVKVPTEFSDNQEVLRSSRAKLKRVVRSKIRTMIVGGDAGKSHQQLPPASMLTLYTDFLTNHIGLLRVSQKVAVGDKRVLVPKPFKWHSATIEPGRRMNAMLPIGEYVTLKKFTYVNVHAAGHVIAETQPVTLVKLFWSLVSGRSIEEPLVPWRDDQEHEYDDQDGPGV